MQRSYPLSNGIFPKRLNLLACMAHMFYNGYYIVSFGILWHLSLCHLSR